MYTNEQNIDTTLESTFAYRVMAVIAHDIAELAQTDAEAAAVMMQGRSGDMPEAARKEFFSMIARAAIQIKAVR